MLLRPDCITCIFKASVSALRELTADEQTIREVVSDILEIPSIRGLDWGLTSPEVFVASLTPMPKRRESVVASWSDRHTMSH